QFVVVAIHEVIGLIQHIGETTGHTRPEVNAGWTEYRHDTTGHIFTAVVASAFNDRISSGVTHPAALARGTGRKSFSARRTIQTCITHDAADVGVERRITSRTTHQPPAGQ